MISVNPLLSVHGYNTPVVQPSTIVLPAFKRYTDWLFEPPFRSSAAACVHHSLSAFIDSPFDVRYYRRRHSKLSAFQVLFRVRHLKYMIMTHIRIQCKSIGWLEILPLPLSRKVPRLN